MSTFDQPLVRWIIEQALNGNMFYAAVAMVTLAAAMRIATSWRGMYGWRRWSQLLFGFGLAGLLVSAGSLTLPWAVYLMLLAAAAMVPRERRRLRRMLLIPTAAMLVLCLVFAVQYETGWPSKRVIIRGPVVVFGDSHSASISDAPEKQAWPAYLQERLDRPVINLATAGGTLATAHSILDEHVVRDSLVIVLLGGEDMLANTSPRNYAAGVARLIQRLQQDGNAVVWVECPVPPNAPWYGWIQHWIAHRHDVRLVPKRVSAAVRVGEGETMARRLEPWLRQWFVFTRME